MTSPPPLPLPLPLPLTLPLSGFRVLDLTRFLAGPWVAAFDAAGVPAGPVLRYDEALADPRCGPAR